MTKILMLGTYPIKNPQHGGQKRVHAILKEYKKAGLNAKYIAIFTDLFYKQYSSTDIVAGRKVRHKIMASPFTGDVELSLAIYNDPKIKKKISKLLKAFAPDIIQLEQMFPYMGLKPLLRELDINVPIVFSSQNIEYEMKQEMLESLGIEDKFIRETVRAIKETEEELARSATLSIAVSEGDAKKLQKMGAKNIIIAPNGIERIQPPPEDVAYWKRKFSKEGVRKVALFVGSAHPPNWFGFDTMVSKGLGFIKKDERIVFGGSISEYTQEQIRRDELGVLATTFWQRAYAAGRLSQPRLEGLIEYSDTILLPITEGGGSNLKTAEAVISGKKIVATSYAFRGFESLKDLPNIYIADTPQDFRHTIVKVMNSPTKELSAEQHKLAEMVLWHNCLKDMILGVKDIDVHA